MLQHANSTSSWVCAYRAAPKQSLQHPSISLPNVVPINPTPPVTRIFCVSIKTPPFYFLLPFSAIRFLSTITTSAFKISPAIINNNPRISNATLSIDIANGNLDVR